MNEQDARYVLPPTLVSPADLIRIIRELESVDNELESQKARAHGTLASFHLPAMSLSFSELLELNRINITDGRSRMALKEQLRHLKDHAPVLHMTFSVTADPESLRTLTEWVRRELHPQALIQVGLQPALVGGVYLRTPNHVHDFSLRAHMRDKRGLIAQKLAGLKGVAQ